MYDINVNVFEFEFDFIKKLYFKYLMFIYTDIFIINDIF